MIRVPFWFLVVIFLGSFLSADTLVLKDGRRLEWSSITDKGDAYEVLCVNGKVLKVNKTDVEKFLQGKVESALTGATFTLDKIKTKPIDILKLINVDRDTLQGSCKFMGDSLQVESSGDIHTKVQTSFQPPEEYDLTIVLERSSGEDDFFIGLVAGGHQFTFHFDAWKGSWTGYTLIDGKNFDEHGKGVSGKLLKNGVRRTVQFLVRKDSMDIRVDGNLYLVWKGDWKRVTLIPILSVKSNNVIFMGCIRSKYKIYSMTALVPKDNP